MATGTASTFDAVDTSAATATGTKARATAAARAGAARGAID
jgi:hypothetical protein